MWKVYQNEVCVAIRETKTEAFGVMFKLMEIDTQNKCYIHSYKIRWEK